MDITQQEVDEQYDEAKAMWGKIVESEGSEAMAFASSEGVQFLVAYDRLQMAVKDAGFELPDVTENPVTITERDDALSEG